MQNLIRVPIYTSEAEKSKNTLHFHILRRLIAITLLHLIIYSLKENNMPFGAQVRTNRGLISLANCFAMKMIDTRTITLTASSNNNGSFNIPLGEYTSFNNAADFDIFCVAMFPNQTSIQQLATLQTFTSYPSTILSNSVATVNYRGGLASTYRFWTYIIEVG